ncbi:hypothetical protein SH1V18_32910 [Vallitalea longa]|uniref:Glycosyltransferase 2-like domain-containing protein n=1 Tax=Vallitalea longa TaxID=2936439 RepID=A0A9W6DF31_9FIRM|nr:glycosyltransferase [Vallitalea longa]GKX30811.1 hypothetical protein SH1V18_32910 [Vallitalea longa]
MDRLSIIIKGKETQLIKYVELLKPLLINPDTELILINNEIEKVDIPYDYSILKFANEYNNFEEYCLTSCIGEKIILIEEGMRLTPDIIDSITKALDRNDHFNISVNHKTYLVEDKAIFFNNEQIFVHHRGTKGFSRYVDLTIEDYRLIDMHNVDIDRNIKSLLDVKYLKELFSWYKNYILTTDHNIQLRFHTALEKHKLSLDNENKWMLEDLFINSDIDNLYTKYLQTKKLQRTDIIEFNKSINENFTNNIISKNLYYSWFIRDSLIDMSIPDYMIRIDTELQKSIIYYLLENDKDSQEYIYNFIMNTASEFKINDEEKLVTYLIIIKNYMDNVSSTSLNSKTNNQLLQLLNLYVYCFNIYLDNYVPKYNIYGEDKFISMYNDAQLLIKEKKVAEAISILMDICTTYQQKTKILYYYIQKLKLANNYYPYVLSICMIVKDEEKNIARCLHSLKPLVDAELAEFVIVDTGSTDNTVEIAKKYTDNILYYKWTGHFSDARNYSILFARGEYIMIMDADEEFQPKELNKLIDTFTKTDYRTYNTFTLRILSYTNTELTNYTGLTQSRIFRNDGEFYYYNAVHNQPKSSLPVKSLDIEFLHYGYIMTDGIREKKFARTGTLLKKELEKDPYNLYFRCQLSSSYGMYGDIVSAVKQVDIYMRIIKDNNMINDLIFMYYNNAIALYMNIGRYDDAEAVCDRGLTYKPDFIDFIYYKAYILFTKGNYESSIVFFTKYLMLLQNYFKLKIANDPRYNFYTIANKETAIRLIIVSNYRLKKYEDCVAIINQIKNNDTLFNCIHEIINSYYYTNRYVEIANFYNNAILSGDEAIKSIFKFFLLDNLHDSDTEQSEKCLSALSSNHVDEALLNEIRKKLRMTYFPDVIDSLDMVNKYDINGIDFECASKVLKSIIPILNSTKTASTNMTEIYLIKRAVRVILHRAKEMVVSNILTVDKLKSIFQKYMELTSIIISQKKLNLLEDKEIRFITEMNLALSDDTDDEYKIYHAKKAVHNYNEMNYIIDIIFNDTLNKTPTSKVKMSAQDYSSEADKLINNKSLHEAEKCLLTGIENYPDNSDIFSRLCKLYSKKNDTKKLIEIYSKFRMINPNINIDHREFIPHKSLDNIKDIKVLQGTMDLTKKTSNIAEILNSKGINTKILNYVNNYTYNNPDYKLDLNKFSSPNDMLKPTIEAASKIIPNFDVFHFHYLKSLTLNYSDLVVLKELNKKIFMNVWGRDALLSYRAAQYNPYVEINLQADEHIRSILEKISKYIPCCIVSNAELIEHVKDYFEKVEHINMMVDIDKYVPNNESQNIPNRNFTIIHTPSLVSDTQSIIKAVENLKQKYDLNFYQMQEMSSENVINDIPKADLIIDQITQGTYSHLAIESMALERPVISWVSDYMKDKYPKDLPVISATPENIEEKLAYILDNRDMLRNVGIEGREYVKKYHNSHIEINKLIDLYTKNKELPLIKDFKKN